MCGGCAGTGGAEELVERVWAGLEPRLRGRILKIVGDGSVVEDLLHDVFVRVYARRHEIQPERAPRYLMRAATNAALDHVRARRRWRRLPPGPPAAGRTPYDVLVAKERARAYDRGVRPALGRLPPVEREAVEFVLEYGTRAAGARARGIPPSTLYTRYRRAVARLRAALGPDSGLP